MIPALSAFMLVTPIFGFSLSIDLPALELAAPADAVSNIAAPEPEPAPTTPDVDPGLVEAPATTVAADVAPEAVAASTTAAEAEPQVDVAALMSQRARYARIHRIFGISTWAMMTPTVIFGTLQYANLYGFFSPRADTRCVRGNAFFGQDACVETPKYHAYTAFATAALYYTTFGLSYGMPDPIGLDRGDSRSARRLRQHKRLRWAHFAGMASQLVLGMLAANPNWIGLDRANDYRALQGLATVHLLSGYMTYGTLTWAGALMAAE